MGGKVYLKTDRFEVKLEGITFKPKDFEYLCRLDFVFPDGKVWDRPPVVGIDVMRHPRDPSVLLLLLCFGVGVVILRFSGGEPLPVPICKFLSDKRIQFVGFGIPEKQELFPFNQLGLKTRKVDVGYLAARTLKDPKCKKWEMSELARRVLGIKKMVGLTDASSPERHAQIKSAICKLFITSTIGMVLLNGDDSKLDASPKRSSFLKNLNSLHSFAEGLFKGRKKNEKFQDVDEVEGSVCVQIGDDDDLFSDGFHGYASSAAEVEGQILRSGEGGDHDDDEVSDATKIPLKGILKCPSTGLKSCKSVRWEEESQSEALKRANSKGRNVSFKCC
ncbi:hypothetical protein C2S53_004733 [Perilla frutescens var. hirtella]|uniref:3'-5' exonuclease domain-containing protein n=1 Tax=Perilla frutescens var. hirtella TaxID=608512 RepID=A0AAD4JIA2_PERFH|nr:hypothetical protein C2S53_004733 [Perilla frutescens var. hirtella]